jgi:hypothetical protein
MESANIIVIEYAGWEPSGTLIWTVAAAEKKIQKGQVLFIGSASDEIFGQIPPLYTKLCEVVELTMLNENYAMIEVLELCVEREEEAEDATFFIPGAYIYGHV